MSEELSAYTRDAKMLPAYQKLIDGQYGPDSAGIRLSPKECRDLVGLISTLEEENRRLFSQTNEVSSDLHELYESED